MIATAASSFRSAGKLRFLRGNLLPKPSRNRQSKGESMQVVNPYYARESAVGRVFDVGTWRHRAILGCVVCVAMAALFAAATFCAVFPETLGDPASEAIVELQAEIVQAHVDYPWFMLAGEIVGGLLAWMFLMMAVSSLIVRSQGPFYLRVGPGGISMRLPGGISMWNPRHKILERDLAWSEIEHWEIVQHKQFGSLSANSGNLEAELNLRLPGGERHSISLSWFREPARVVWSKIQDAMEMTPMDLPAEAPEYESAAY